MNRASAPFAGRIATIGALFACWACQPASVQVVVKQNFLNDLGQAGVVLPVVPVERHIGFSTGRWEFHTSGHLLLTRQHPFFNRLDFVSADGFSDVELGFRYQTRWTEANEQNLSLVYRNAALEGSDGGFEISVLSDGRISVALREVDADTRTTQKRALAESRPIPTTNEAWHQFRLRIASGTVSVEVDGETALTCTLPAALSQRIDPVADRWSLELSRTGPGLHRTQVRLADMEARFETAGRMPETFRAFPTSSDRAAADASYLMMKYRVDRAYIEDSLKYLERKLLRPLGERQEQLIGAWFAPPGSAFRFSVRAEPGDRVQGRYGFDFGKKLSDEPPVTFYLRAYWDDHERELFRHVVSGSDQLDNGDLFPFNVPVPPESGKDLTLELGVVADETKDGGLPLRLYGTYFASVALTGEPNTDAARPNIILISVDTLRPDFTEPYAPGKVLTPAISSLALDSVRFDHAFSASPWTMPSHLSIFTGLYPSKHGLNRAFGYNQSLAEPSIKTLAETLSDAGYYTAAIASDHSLDPLYGFDKGFDSFLNVTTRDVQELLPHFHTFLERHQQDQFFLFLHTYDPHGSLFRNEGLEHLERGRFGDIVTYSDVGSLGETSDTEKHYLKSLYQNHVAYFDRYFGEILESLKTHDLYDDTIIVFTSDHGEELLERSAYLHGHSLHSEVLRVPLLIKFPNGKWPRATDALTGTIDIFPTLAEYLELPLPENIDGKSTIPVLKGDSRSHRRILLAEGLAFGPERKAVLSRQYTYIWTLGESEKGALTPRSTAHSPVISWDAGEELFDVLSDPGETINVLDQRPELGQRLKEHVEQLLAAKTPRGTVIVRDADRLEALRSLGYVQD